MKITANTAEADMNAFLEAHRAFHGRDRFTQYEHSAAAVITAHREAATTELRAVIAYARKRINDGCVSDANKALTDAELG